MEEKKKGLVWLISFLMVAGFISTSIVSYLVAISSLRSRIAERELPLTSDNIYSEIQKDLLQPIFISSLMASDTFLRDWVINGEKDPARIIRYLKQIQTRYNTFTSFFVSEKTRIYYHAGGILKTVKQTESRDAWYFRVRQMTPEYEINVDPDMANKDLMTIFINFKVHDYSGNFIGATGVGLQVGAVKKLISRYQENYNRNIFFVDTAGDIVLYGSAPPQNAGSIDQIDGLKQKKDRILSVQRDTFTIERAGATVHLNTRYIPEFDWYLLVEQTEKDAVRPIFKALLTNFAICAVITLIVIGLTNWIVSSYQRNLERMATKDKLTGAYNRQAFDIIISQMLKDIKRRKMAFSIILFDIDDFKAVNDSYGHLAGDEVIRKVAWTVSQTVRFNDILCRWGGEEFLVLLKDCSLDNAWQISEKIRRIIEVTKISYGDHQLSVTVSLGVTQYQPDESEDALISRVDRLLYKAKTSGKNRSEK